MYSEQIGQFHSSSMGRLVGVVLLGTNLVRLANVAVGVWFGRSIGQW